MRRTSSSRSSRSGGPTGLFASRTNSLRPPLGLLLLATIFVSACATAASNSACPPLREWSADEQLRAADELALLPADSILDTMFRDYSRLRDQVRACH